MSTPYRRAKQQSAQRASLWWQQPMTQGDVQLVTRFWFPDMLKRDAGNYRKLLTDALTGVVYVDDSQVIDERYIRVGVDRANPRAELTVTLLVDGMEQAA